MRFEELTFNLEDVEIDETDDFSLEWSYKKFVIFRNWLSKHYPFSNYYIKNNLGRSYIFHYDLNETFSFKTDAGELLDLFEIEFEIIHNSLFYGYVYLRGHNSPDVMYTVNLKGLDFSACRRQCFCSHDWLNRPYKLESKEVDAFLKEISKIIFL